MKQTYAFLPLLFTVVMLICVLFVAWYIPSLAQLNFQLQDIGKSLETSYGRERKQQYEYDETVAEIPEVQAELSRLTPLTEAALDEVASLKAERKQLREKKKELEARLDSGLGKGTENDE